jgi:hypothetical protein
MTDIPEPAVKETPHYLSDVTTLEDLFTLGYVESKPILVFDNQEKNIRIEVIFRTLLPYEIRDIFEFASNFNSLFAQQIAEKLETLARAVKTINNRPLFLGSDDRKVFKDKHGREPTALDEAKVILSEKIKSPLVIDALWKEYEKFKTDVAKIFEEDLKKKF